MYFILALVLVLVAATVGTGVYAIRHGIRHGRVKRIMGMNLASFFVVMIGAVIFFIAALTRARNRPRILQERR